MQVDKRKIEGSVEIVVFLRHKDKPDALPAVPAVFPLPADGCHGGSKISDASRGGRQLMSTVIAPPKPETAPDVEPKSEGLIASFASERAVVEAVKVLRSKGFEQVDVHSPHPIHEASTDKTAAPKEYHHYPWRTGSQ